MTKVTVGQLLDLMDNNGNVQCKAMVCSEIWDGLEDRTVNSIQVEGDALGIWLDDK